jgi:hypothetical protein
MAGTTISPASSSPSAHERDHGKAAPRNIFARRAVRHFAADRQSLVAGLDRNRARPRGSSICPRPNSIRAGNGASACISAKSKALDKPRAFPLGYFVARSFIADRLALIGDAAHVIHPIAGQGLNLGLKDVAALAEVVVDAARLGIDPGRPMCWSATSAGGGSTRWRWASPPMALNMLFSNRSTLLRTVRDIGLGLVDRVPPLKSALHPAGGRPRRRSAAIAARRGAVGAAENGARVI